MGFLSRKLDRFCYKHPKFGIPNLMKYIVLGNVLVYVGDMFTRGGFSWIIRFYPELILEGQVWRIITFIFSPVSTGSSNPLLSVLFFALVTYFYYSIGTALERQWGTARFSTFYFLGIALNIAVGFITYAINPVTANLMGGYYYETAQMYYVNMSLFFSIATIYPDMRILLYGIIPLKIKWLAWLDAALFAFDIGYCVTSGNWPGALLPILAIFNYLLFFWEDLMGILKRGKRRTVHKINPQTVNFKAAQKQVQQSKGYLHKCAVCGITDADNPDMEFRYCSKCNGYYCYCMKHINDHVHVK